MSEWNEWDAELLKEEDSTGLEAYYEALTTEAGATEEPGFQDAASSADTAKSFEADAESWASYSADASASAADSLDDAATAYTEGDTAGGDFALRQAEVESSTAEWAGGVADSIDTGADTCAVQSYDTAVDASWDATAAEASYDAAAPVVDTGAAYETSLDDLTY